MSENAPEVSVIIICYNRKDLLVRAIESVLRQTFHNFELIIVDDGSSEDVGGMIKEKYGSDRRIRYFFVEHIGKLGAVRNIGISKSQAPYVAFLDSDDEWLPEKLEEQIRVIKQSDRESTGIVGCDFYIINVNTGRERIYQLKFNERIMNPIEGILSGKIPTYPTLYLLKMEALKKIGFFDEKFSGADDYDLLVRILEQYKFSWIKKMLCRYHVHSSHRSVLPGIVMAQIQDRMRLFSKFRHYYENCRMCTSWNLMTIGRLQILSGMTRQGIKTFFNAILKNPLDIRSYLHFILALFGSTVYRKVFKLWAYFKVGH